MMKNIALLIGAVAAFVIAGVIYYVFFCAIALIAFAIMDIEKVHGYNAYQIGGLLTCLLMAYRLFSRKSKE